MGGQSDAQEVVFDGQEEFGVDAIEHPLRLDVVSNIQRRIKLMMIIIIMKTINGPADLGEDSPPLPHLLMYCLSMFGRSTM